MKKERKNKKIVVEKPWGKFEQFTLNERSSVKILTANPGQRLSYQSHEKREEFWRCIKGEVEVVINDIKYLLKEGDEIYIPKKAKHRLVGTEKQGQVLEISFGFFDEDDIKRHEDDYGRIES